MTPTARGPSLLSYVRHETRVPTEKWLIGNDLGQRFDHSAISVIELSWTPIGRCPVDYSWLFQPRLTLRGLERIPLGTSYEEIHLIIGDKLKSMEYAIVRDTNRAPPKQELVIDAGGPGPPMVDRLRRTLKGLQITPVIITGGKGENGLANGYTSVPRRTIITRLVQMISTQMLRCPESLSGFNEFREELLHLSGTTTHPQGRQMHDDLVMSTGLAAWAALRDFPELYPTF